MNRLEIAEEMTIYHVAEHKQQILAALESGDGLELDLSHVAENRVS